MDGALVIAESHNPLWLEWEWRASIHVFPPRRATAVRSKLLRAPWWWVMSSIVMWAIIHSHFGSSWAVIGITLQHDRKVKSKIVAIITLHCSIGSSLGKGHTYSYGYHACLQNYENSRLCFFQLYLIIFLK
jgi:hypothetical protein